MGSEAHGEGGEGAEVAGDAAAFAAAAVRRLRAAAAENGRYPGNRRTLQERYSWRTFMDALRNLVLPGEA